MSTDAPERSAVSSNRVLQALRNLTCELRDLDVGRQVSEIAAPVCPLQFYRSFVGPNKPALITGAIDDWPALKLWTSEYLTYATQDQQVTVACTPNGRADAIQLTEQGPVFVLPHEKQLRISQVLQHFHKEQAAETSEQVLYLQAQNDSFRSDFSSLSGDIATELPWATAAFGGPPEAVNIWIGNHRSVTSFHRDHYENMYAVLWGTKRFLLLPPSDRYRMHMMTVPVAKWSIVDRKWQLCPQEGESISWCPIDMPEAAESQDHQSYPQFFDSSLPDPLVVEVHAGQVLYLPSMWYHMVQQQDDASGRVIAVNYWYDMQFDCKYAFSQLIEELCEFVCH